MIEIENLLDADQRVFGKKPKPIQRQFTEWSDMKNNRKIGDEKERFACDWLEKHGYHVIERNFRCRSGEIDIVAREGAYLVFIEVKYRREAVSGGSEPEVVLYRNAFEFC